MILPKSSGGSVFAPSRMLDPRLWQAPATSRFSRGCCRTDIGTKGIGAKGIGTEGVGVLIPTVFTTGP